MFDLLNFIDTGFIITLGLLLLVGGAIMLYCYRRLNILENSVIEHGKILQNFIMNYNNQMQRMVLNTTALDKIVEEEIDVLELNDVTDDVTDGDDGDDEEEEEAEEEEEEEDDKISVSDLDNSDDDERIKDLTIEDFPIMDLTKTINISEENLEEKKNYNKMKAEDLKALVVTKGLTDNETAQKMKKAELVKMLQ